MTADSAPSPLFSFHLACVYAGHSAATCVITASFHAKTNIYKREYKPNVERLSREWRKGGVGGGGSAGEAGAWRSRGECGQRGNGGGAGVRAGSSFRVVTMGKLVSQHPRRGHRLRLLPQLSQFRTVLADNARPRFDQPWQLCQAVMLTTL